MPVPPPILAELLVDQRQVGLVSLDASGAIVGTNALGREILRQDAGLCERDGKLRTQRVEDAEALECLLAPAVGGQMESGSAGFAAVRGWPSWRPLTVYVNRANGSCPGVAAIVVVLDPWRRIRLRPEQVAKSLGLTPAESRVAVSLAEGLTIREIAESTNRRVVSVRSLVQQALSRTWTSRQADLVRLVLSSSHLPVAQSGETGPGDDGR